MNTTILRAPFAASLIRERPGQSGQLLYYVPTAAVIQRLNEGCDAWDFTVERHEVLEGEVIVLGRLVADGVTKSAFGGSIITTDRSGAVVSIADDLKAAASDSLKKCASLLGVGLELYSGQGAQPQAPASGNNGAYNQGSGAGSRGMQQAPADVADRATVRQLSAVHALARKRGMNKDRLASYVVELVGRTDLSHLSRADASALIDALNSGNGAAH